MAKHTRHKWFRLYDPGMDPNEVRYAMSTKRKQRKCKRNRRDLANGLALYYSQQGGAL